MSRVVAVLLFIRIFNDDVGADCTRIPLKAAQNNNLVYIMCVIRMFRNWFSASNKTLYAYHLQETSNKQLVSCVPVSCLMKHVFTNTHP